ncbi:DUF6261 family protein [Parabacteroides hominis]|uniref:Uncharacterized protein n=1 Tax=Parabacteroides hominis TaxID=2763057 RepID=A0ABR7DU36_9BACT|nr:DUF6261 family protein [Parabacteroides hominis]MBC5634867.1 hypothetical protein [Parabacteroides hominis]
MKEIIEAHFGASRNAEHYLLHAGILAIITPEFAEKYCFCKIREEYASLFKAEDTAYLQSRAYEDTRLVNQKDAERDRVFTMVRQTIDAFAGWPVSAKREAGVKLAFVLKPFRGANSKPIAENIAMVANFLQEIRRDDLKSAVTELGLDELLTLLETLNNECNVIYNTRSDAKLIRSVADNLREIRPKVDTGFRMVAKAVNSLFMVNLLVEQDADKEQELEDIIDRVNALLLQFGETLLRRKAGMKPSVKPGSNIPVDDKPGGEEERPGEL